MIDQTLRLIADRLNAHLSALFSVSEELVAIGPLSDAEGRPTAESRNRLTMFVTNIAQDTMPRGAGSRGPLSDGQNRPFHLDIYFMLASGHDPEIYDEGLKLISAALTYFQANTVMTPRTAPDMPPGLSQLSIEIANLKAEEIGQLWGNLGGRYVPSVMFKVRSVMIDAGAVTSITPLVRGPAASAKAEAG
ncbi:MAG: DUF4255 domain-containing protein [Pseudomonadota bacterium]